MKENKLKKYSTEDLKKKGNLFKILMAFFIPIILLLVYFSLRDKMGGGEIEMPPLIVAFCSLTIMFSLVPQLKAIQKELKERNLNREI